jgi:formylmethanofuran dehydrogenase subunit E
MNSEDMANFIESLSPEQMSQFQQVFKTIGDTMGVETKEEPEQKEEIASSNIEVNEDFTVTRKINDSTRRNPVKAKKNKWVDDGSFQLEGEEEFSSDRKRSSRNRGKTKKLELECSVCGKKYMEHASLVYGEYHRCNRCGGK